jgi:GTP pyrophosphokinase
VYAAQLHTGQIRKGSGVPYVSHLLGVAALVLEHGGDEEQAIAALLHDAVEDQGGEQRLRAILGRYGERVARIVWACSDAAVQPKPPWRQRKEAYLAQLLEDPPDTLLVSVADKLHNARTLLLDYYAQAEAVFAPFRGGKDGTLWYFRGLVTAYRTAGFTCPLVDELDQVVTALEQETAE